MSGDSIVATIECQTCSAWIEVYPEDVLGEPKLGWMTRDEQLCKSPPLKRCPHARAEIKQRFPKFD